MASDDKKLSVMKSPGPFDPRMALLDYPKPKPPSMEKWDKVKKTDLHKLYKGETVVPAKKKATKAGEK